MTMETRDVPGYGIRFSITKEGIEAAHAYLYLLKNDLHDQAFGLLEDLHVDEGQRSGGIGSELLKAVIERAQAEKCYKLIATSRNDGSRTAVHEWYTRLGFQDYGKEFRMDF